MSTELYQLERPQTLDQVIGQDEAVRVIREKLAKKNFPKACLITGPSGCGKTTLARIIGRELGGGPFDFKELNAAESRGIDTIREISSRMYAAPSGKARIYYYDECHQLTRRAGGDAQTAMLKMLEDPPAHVYHILASTDPQQLLLAIRTRCTTIELKPIAAKLLRKLLDDVVLKYKIKIADEETLDAIVETAEGSARMALNLLDKIMDAAPEDQLGLVQKSDAKRQAFDIVKALLWQKTNWADMAKILREVDTSDPEGIRHMILAVANKELLKAGKNCNWVFLILDAFSKNWYDQKESGLATCCYDVLAARK